MFFCVFFSVRHPSDASLQVCVFSCVFHSVAYCHVIIEFKKTSAVRSRISSKLILLQAAWDIIRMCFPFFSSFSPVFSVSFDFILRVSFCFFIFGVQSVPFVSVATRYTTYKVHLQDVVDLASRGCRMMNRR